MARRRRIRDRDVSQREAYDFTRQSLLEELERDRPARPFVRSAASSVDWQDVEDRRHWHPEGDDRPALDFDAVPVRVIESVRLGRRGAASDTVTRPARARRGREGSRLAFSHFPAGVQAFEFPRSTVVCARRKERREVLFAKGRGRGRAGKVRKRTWMSEVSC